MRKLKTLLLLVVFAGLAVGYVVYMDTSAPNELAESLPDQKASQTLPAEKQVSTPPPLRGPTQEKQATLTAPGVVSETNKRRQQNGLPPLSVNAKLAQSAQIKTADMFDRQYFAHVSPTGEDVADLAEEVNYQYLNVGENLAVGNYEGDIALVQAWMDSPGHRENILNENYTEIGVAVQQGTYEGRTTWMAVQEFGRPASACPSPSNTLNTQIEQNQTTLNGWEQELEEQKREIENTTPKRGPAYNRKVEAYNELVNAYNELLEETKQLISQYNTQVEAFNACVN